MALDFDRMDVLFVGRCFGKISILPSDRVREEGDSPVHGVQHPAAGEHSQLEGADQGAAERAGAGCQSDPGRVGKKTGYIFKKKENASGFLGWFSQILGLKITCDLKTLCF